MEKKNILNAKGFLFTISVIFFSATLVFFAQSFAVKSLAEQNDILASVKLLGPGVVADDIASDFKELASFSATTAFSDGNLVVSISDTIQKRGDFATQLAAYKTFIDTNYFPRIQGIESLDFNGVQDGNFDVNIGSTLMYSNNYANTEVLLLNTTGTGLKSIDLNLFVEGDLNSYTWDPAGAGTVPITINFFGDHNSFSILENVSVASESLLTFWHDNNVDDVTFVSIGPVLSSNGSVRIDSNSLNKVSFSLDANYAGYASSQPVDVNIVLTRTEGTTTTNSLLRIWK